MACSLFLPPLVIRGMKVLNIELFKKTVEVPALQTKKPETAHLFLNILQSAVIEGIVIKKIYDIFTPNANQSASHTPVIPNKAVLLKPDYSFTSEQQTLIAQNEASLITVKLFLDFNNWDYHTILKAILPEDCTIPSAFETVGHIAHLNLRTEQLEYKHIIGQVLIEKFKPIKTVVNKIGVIENEFRVFNMEFIAGDSEAHIVTLKENYATFKFDYTKSFWNSRLQGQREKFLTIVQPGQVILDAFAGVGPFSILACRNKCFAHANDHNPDCFKWMNENATLNKVQDRMKTYNLDARKFIMSVTENLIQCELSGDAKLCNQMYSHALMNLPETAVNFLDTFIGLFSQVPQSLRPNFKLPTIHCYTFAEGEDLKANALSRVEKVLECKLENPKVEWARDISTKKRQYLISFKLPEAIAYKEKMLSEENSEQYSNKKIKLDEPLIS